MKWYRFIPVVLMGAFLLGSVLVQPASAVLQDSIPGSLLIFPYFDCSSGFDTKIRLTNEFVLPVRIRLTYICEPSLPPQAGSSAFCNLHDKSFLFTPHQKRIFDVCNESPAGICPTRRGFVVAFAEAQCDPSSSTGCLSGRGTVEAGEFAPISFNALTGDEQVFSGCAEPGKAPCTDVEAVNAQAVQSPEPPFIFDGIFLGADNVPPNQQVSLTFCDAPAPPSRACDYLALPRQLRADFAAVNGHLVPGPFDPFPGPIGSGSSPFGIGGFPDNGIETETNFILFTMDILGEDFNTRTGFSVNLWNWHEVNFTLSGQFICWEKVSSTVLSPLFEAGALGSPYGTATFLPTTAGRTLLGAVEEVVNLTPLPAPAPLLERTLRLMFHTGAQATTWVTDVEGP